MSIRFMIAEEVTLLARAALAEDGEGLAAVDVPADAVDRVDRAPRGVEARPQRFFDLEQVVLMS